MGESFLRVEDGTYRESGGASILGKEHFFFFRESSCTGG
jgi:hypothetical protein